MRELITVTVKSKRPPQLDRLASVLPAVWTAAYTFDIYHEKEVRAFVSEQLALSSTISVAVA